MTSTLPPGPSTSPPSSSLRRAVLQHPSLNARIPTSSHLSSLISQAQAQLASQDASLLSLRQALSNALQSNLHDVKRQKEQLHALPSQIEEVEDRLLEITSHLENDDGKGNGGTGGTSNLMESLLSQQQALLQMRAARDYFGILAEAENLAKASLEAESKENGQKEALRLLEKLAKLAGKAESIGATPMGADAADDATVSEHSERRLHAISFILSQRDYTYETLVTSRCARLRKALKEAGWPPIPAQVAAHTNQRVLSVQQILADTQVREAWRGVCRLQRKASRSDVPKGEQNTKKGGWLDPPSALVSHRPSLVTGAQQDRVQRAAAGHRNFVPLLAVKVLMEPLLLRFRYHFDSDRDTNRLDKPEWFLSHALMLVREHANAFAPSTPRFKGGPIAQLCQASGYAKEGEAHLDLMMDLLHHLLEPLRNKLENSRQPLLEESKSELLAHTISEAAHFDATLRELVPEAIGTPIDSNADSLTETGEKPSTLDSDQMQLQGGAIRLSEVLLSDPNTFETWLSGERDFAQDRFDEILDSAEAWTIGGESGEEEEEMVDGSWEAAHQLSTSDVPHNPTDGRLSQMKTTRSARAVVELVNSLTMRYETLDKLSHQVPFVLIQLSLLRGYGNRLVKSLDAFESLSSAFARHLPGGIESSAIPGSAGPDSDMVRGLRGLGRLLKAYLSASFLVAQLERMAESSFFAELGFRLGESEEGRAALAGIKRLDDVEEERELDSASLGELVRRGVRAGGEAARRIRPLGVSITSTTNSTSRPSTGGSGNGSAPKTREGSSLLADDQQDVAPVVVDIWAQPKLRLKTLRERAAKGIERLVVSEVNEQLRAYSLRTWCASTSISPDSSPKNDINPDTEGVVAEDDEGEEDEIPTPTLLSALSILSTHLGHLIPSLPPNESVPIYRRIAQGIARNVVERVVLSGGAHRFDQSGARRFSSDFTEGWLAVVRDVELGSTSSNLLGGSGSATTSASASTSRHRVYPMGRNPEAPWRSLRDVVVLLSLPSSSSSGVSQPSIPISGLVAQNSAAAQQWNLAKAIRALFDEEVEDEEKGLKALKRDLGLEERLEVRFMRDVVRRRVECWK